MLLSMKQFHCETPGSVAKGVFNGVHRKYTRVHIFAEWGIHFQLGPELEFILPAKSSRIYTPSLQQLRRWQNTEAADKEHSEKTESCWAAQIQTEASPCIMSTSSSQLADSKERNCFHIVLCTVYEG